MAPFSEFPTTRVASLSPGTGSDLAYESGYSPAEEVANWITHGIGVVLSLVALTLLIVFSATRGDAWHVASFTIYGLSLLALYSASTAYHAVRSAAAKRLLKKFDHAAIFCLIAGTYTPFLLTSLRGPWGWSLFGVVWGLSAVGIVLKFFFAGRFRVLSTLTYVVLGWLILIALKPLAHQVPAAGVWLLVAGGGCYTAGVTFYLWKRLRFHHAVWHLFVLGGSTCHFLAVLLYLLPPNA